MIGNLVLTADSSTPQLFSTKFGQLPQVFSSDRGVPTPLGGTPPRNPNLTGLCEIVAAPPGLGLRLPGPLLRRAGQPVGHDPDQGRRAGDLPDRGTDAATLTCLGKRGVRSGADDDVDFTAPKGSKLAAFVK